MTWSPVIRRRDSRSCNSSRGIWSQRYHFAARLPPTAPPTKESTDNATARPIRRQNRMAPAPPGEHVETMGTRREGGGSGPVSRARLLRRLDQAWQAFQESYAGLLEAELVEPGVKGTGSGKDIRGHGAWGGEEVLAHVAV